MKAAFQHVLALLRCDVGVQNKLSRVNAELFLRSNLEGILRSRRKIDSSNVKARRFDYRQPGANQRLLRRMMGIDVETIRYPKMKIDLGRPLGRNVDLCGRNKLDSILPRQRQWLVFEDLQPQKHQYKEHH